MYSVDFVLESSFIDPCNNAVHTQNAENMRKHVKSTQLNIHFSTHQLCFNHIISSSGESYFDVNRILRIFLSLFQRCTSISLHQRVQFSLNKSHLQIRVFS